MKFPSKFWKLYFLKGNYSNIFPLYGSAEHELLHAYAYVLFVIKNGNVCHFISKSLIPWPEIIKLTNKLLFNFLIA